MAGLERSKARLDDEHHAGEAGDDGEPAPGPDLFLEKDQRQDGDEERRQEDQRIDFGERNGGEGDDAEDAGDDARDGAALHAPWPLHAPEVEPMLVLRRRQDDAGAGNQRDEEADLEDRQFAAERLDGRVAPRIGGVGEQRQQDSVVQCGCFRNDSAPAARPRESQSIAPASLRRARVFRGAPRFSGVAICRRAAPAGNRAGRAAPVPARPANRRRTAASARRRCSASSGSGFRARRRCSRRRPSASTGLPSGVLDHLLAIAGDDEDDLLGARMVVAGVALAGAAGRRRRRKSASRR